MSNNGFFARFIGYTLAGILLLLFLHSFLYHYFPNVLQLGLFSEQDKQESAEPRVVQARGNLAEDEKSTIELFENSRDSVVFITTRQRVMDAWTRNIFSVPSGTGSGFIWESRQKLHNYGCRFLRIELIIDKTGIAANRIFVSNSQFVAHNLPDDAAIGAQNCCESLNGILQNTGQIATVAQLSDDVADD